MNRQTSPLQRGLNRRSPGAVMPRSAFAAWQHRFDIDSNFLSYPAPLSLVNVA